MQFQKKLGGSELNTLSEYTETIAYGTPYSQSYTAETSSTLFITATASLISSSSNPIITVTVNGNEVTTDKVYTLTADTLKTYMNQYIVNAVSGDVISITIDFASSTVNDMVCCHNIRG